MTSMEIEQAQVWRIEGKTWPEIGMLLRRPPEALRVSVERYTARGQGVPRAIRGVA